MTDRINGIPEGYRLGKVLASVRGDNITFELIPIEQPKQLEASHPASIIIREREKGNR